MEPLPHVLRLAFGRPTWKEVRQRTEAAAVRAAPPPLPDGHGQSVLIVPGYGGSEASMTPLRSWLASGGFEVRVAPLERNIRSSTWAARRIEETLQQFASPPVVIGHSRGGQQARVVACRRPGSVQRLITLGAPIRHHHPRHFAIRTSFEVLRAAAFLRLHAEWVPDGERRFERDLQAPFPSTVPWVSIHSPTDGYVAPQATLDPAAESVAVDCSHRGLVESVPAFEVLASLL